MPILHATFELPSGISRSSSGRPQAECQYGRCRNLPLPGQRLQHAFTGASVTRTTIQLMSDAGWST